MDTTQIKSTRSVVLNQDDVTTFPSAFETKEPKRDRQGDLRRVLASSFLKYSEEAKKLSAEESVESFIALYHLHQRLEQQVEQFLLKEMPFVRDNRPLNELLLSFASFCLTQASRTYYFESLTARDTSEIQNFKQQVQACQKDFDNLIQAL